MTSAPKGGASAVSSNNSMMAEENEIGDRKYEAVQKLIGKAIGQVQGLTRGESYYLI